jgi:hypothetical protein
MEGLTKSLARSSEIFEGCWEIQNHLCTRKQYNRERKKSILYWTTPKPTLAFLKVSNWLQG